jgi:hypothetical protein
VAELALNDLERYAVSSELHGVRVAQLMRREPAADSRLGRQPAEFGADPRRSTRAARGWGRR